MALSDNVVEVIIRARDEATAELKKLDGTVKSIGLSFAALGTAALGTAALLGRMAEQGGDQAEELKLLGAQSGQTAEQMSRLKFAADQNNVSIQAVGQALRFMNRNLFDAKDGGGLAFKALQSLGFSNAQLSAGLGTSNEAFLKIIGRLNDVSDAGTRTALTLKIFGRGAVEIAPLIGVGVDKLKELEAESDKVGATISNTAAIIGQQFGDSVRKVKDQIDGLKAKVAVALLPSMQSVVESVSSVLTRFNQFAARNPGTVQAIALTATLFGALSAAIVGIIVALPLLSAGLAALGVSLSAFAVGGGVIALAAAGFGLLTARLLSLRAQADAPLKFQFVSNAEDAGKQLADLSQKIADLEAKANAIRSRGGGERLTNTGTALSTGIATGLSFFAPSISGAFGLNKGAADLLEINRQLGVAKDSFKLAADQAKSFGDSTVEAGDKGTATLDDLIASAIKVGNVLEAIRLTKLQNEINSTSDAIGELAQNPKPLTASDLLAPSGSTALGANLGETIQKKSFEFTIQGKGLEAFKELKPEADDADLALQAMFKDLERLGIPAETLNEQFGKTGLSLNSLKGQLTVFGDVLGASFAQAFNPLRTGIEGIQTAVGNFKATFDDAFQSAIDKILEGHASMLKFSTAIDGAFKAMARLAFEIAAAIIKAEILKALGFASFFSGGGQVVDTVGQAASGGTAVIRGYDSGTFRVVPGSPQARDSVLAMLAPGEAVLPTVGGQNPGLIVSKLASLSDKLDALINRQSPAVATAPVVGNVTLNAFDAASVRNMVRSGEFAYQFARGAELRG